jgi:hypothetical protein
MDRERFDQLTRFFGSTRSRRGAVAAFLSIAVSPTARDAMANPGKAAGKGHHKGRGKGHTKPNEGHGHDQDAVVPKEGCPPDAVTDEPGFICKDGTCSCGGKCCQGQCFLDIGESGVVDEFCCTGPKLVFCPQPPSDPNANPTCCANSGDGIESCRECLGPTLLVRSYRRA